MKLEPPSTSQIVRLKITLDWIKPAIWRRIEVPLNAPLVLLHQAIQAAMLFENYHLFAFEVGPRRRETRYAIPDPDGDFTPTVDARRTPLGSLIANGIQCFTYTYDFGDDWRHSILVEAAEQASPSTVYPRFLAGANHAPPEDVGGFPGFEQFLEVMADPAQLIPRTPNTRTSRHGTAASSIPKTSPKPKSRSGSKSSKKPKPKLGQLQSQDCTDQHTRNPGVSQHAYNSPSRCQRLVFVLSIAQN